MNEQTIVEIEDELTEEVLQEVNISTLRPTTMVRGSLRVDRQSIIILVPDTNLKIWDYLYDTGLLITNCQAVIAPVKRFTIGRKKFNAKIHQLELKRHLIKREGPGRKLRVVSSIPINLRNRKDKLTSAKPESKYYFYDASIYSQATKYLADKFSNKMLTGIIFRELSSLYTNLKTSLPTSNIDLLFLIKDEQGNFAEMFKNLHMALPEKDFSSLRIYDNFILATNTDGVILPLAYKQKGNNKLHRPNIVKFQNIISAKEEANRISGESPISEENTDEEADNRPRSDFVSRMVQSLKQSNLKTTVDNNGVVKIGLDRNQVTKLLKKHKINDPDIAINVKSSIDAYIKEKGEKLNTDEAETLVLKAINYTLHGTDDVTEDYISKPELLFKKLNETKTYRVPLTFPKMGQLIDPLTVIDIDYTTGQYRQKFEFEQAIHENVKKLLNSVEDVKQFPIQVKNVTWELKDDTQDRFILYTITLKNVSGGSKKPYQVQLKVPGIVNDKYFKLHGSNYIIASQQFMKPITKTDKNEVRILSSYAIIRVGIKNLKFNPSDIDDIIDKYIKIRYPNIVKDKSTIFFYGENVYIDEANNIQVTIDQDNGKLIDSSGEEIKLGRSEYLYEIILSKIAKVNPEDQLHRTKKSIPYIFIYLSGVTIPLIYYLWSQKGLLTTLNDFGIDYEMSNTDKLTESVGDQSVQGYTFVPTGDKYLAIRPKNTREQLIVNGLFVSKVRNPINNLDDPNEVHELISNIYGSGAVTAIFNMTENMIDPVTKELLEFENLPTKLPNLISQHVVPMLMERKADSLSDLKIYRSRMSEMVLQSMYKQIKQAHNDYKMKAEYGDPKAELWLDTDYIIRDMITDAGVLQHTDPVTPVDEIMLASRVIKSGKGGVQSKQMFKAEQRNVHPSQYGIISANSTPEGTNVGIITRHTLTPTIVNKYGSYGAKDITGLSGWNTLAIEEALIPFQNEVDSDRMVMATTHQGQVTPIEKSEAPLVGTGAEFIVPQLTSSRFVHKAKMDGKVLSVDKNKTITIKYRNGQTETLDIIPRKSRTKMAAYISLEMKTLDPGENFKKDQLIAFTKNFTKDSRYASGKNVFIAVVNPSGFGHEDAYVISREFANDAKRDVVKEVHAIIPTDVKILNMETTIGKIVQKDEVLTEFVYQDDLDSYLEINDLVDETDEEISSVFGSGDHSIKLLSIEGEIIDIKVFINNKNSVDPQIVNFHKKLVADTKRTIGILGKSNKGNLKSVDNIEVEFFRTGGHKYKQTEFQGARIVYYIKQQKPLLPGDKIANRYGAKGVIGKIFDVTPKGEITPRIDVFISPVGVFSRKNIAMIKELYLGKIMYYLNEKCREWANSPRVKTDKIIKIVLDVYKLLASDRVYKNLKENINKLTESKLRKMFKDEDYKFSFMVEPFTTVSFKDIKTAAEHIDIELDEKVYIPELETWTKEKVPVGVAYYNALEQFSEVYSNVRSTGMYQGLTRQPARGKAKQGGQSVGLLDMNALLTYNVPSVLNELFTLRSDDHRSKRMVNNSIITTGEASIPKESGRGGTSQLLNTYIQGMGLEIV
jgi:DNA-directed RNA polymerase beta subunit